MTEIGVFFLHQGRYTKIISQIGDRKTENESRIQCGQNTPSQTRVIFKLGSQCTQLNTEKSHIYLKNAQIVKIITIVHSVKKLLYSTQKVTHLNKIKNNKKYLMRNGVFSLHKMPVYKKQVQNTNQPNTGVANTGWIN